MAPHLFYFHFPLQITKIVLLFFFSWNIRRFEIFKREFEWSMMTSKQAQSFSTLSYHRALHCIGHWTPLIHWQGIVEISGAPVSFSSYQRNLIDSDWGYDCTDHKNVIGFFMRLVKWPKIALKKYQIRMIFDVENWRLFLTI